MIRFMILFLSLIASLKAAPSLVFIHLGPELPAYLPIALNQARLFNPDLDIYLLANKAPLSHLSDEITKSHPICVAAESLPKQAQHAKFSKESKLDKKFRQGFWTFTTERFFYLAELIHHYNLTDVFHLENDVMIYTSLEELLPVFKAQYQNKIGATFDNDSRCIPGLVYIASYFPIEQLIDFIASQAKKGAMIWNFWLNFIDPIEPFGSIDFQSSLPTMQTTIP